jgi:hypothetical protein
VLTVYQILKFFLVNRFILVDLDYTLCDNQALSPDKAIGIYSYEMDYSIRSAIYEKLESNDIKGRFPRRVIFSARGLRALPFSREWLARKGIGYEGILHLGETVFKLWFIKAMILLRKDFALVDDWGDVDFKSGGYHRNSTYPKVLTLAKDGRFLYIDSTEVSR